MKLNNSDLDIACEFAIDKERFFKKYSDNKLVGLVDIMFNDTTSSLLRECVTVHISGYDIIWNKLGYDGKKEDGSFCEAKPSNSYKSSDGTVKRKLNGGGNFNDYNLERYENDINEDLYMVIGGFVEGEIAYVLKFRFDSCDFSKKILETTKKRIKSMNEGKTKRIVVSFSYRDYEYDGVEVPYLNINLVRKNKEYFAKNFYNFLEDLNADIR